jgi:hypothetical protein
MADYGLFCNRCGADLDKTDHTKTCPLNLDNLIPKAFNQAVYRNGLDLAEQRLRAEIARLDALTITYQDRTSISLLQFRRQILGEAIDIINGKEPTK